MNLKAFNEKRTELNLRLADADDFFSEFGALDDSVYAGGGIPKKYKELTWLSISIIARCDECIAYHLQNCKAIGCTRQQALEAIKIAVIGGGSVTFPWARKAIALLDDLEFNEPC